MIKKRRPYSNYYKKRQYFLGGVLGALGSMGGPVGTAIGTAVGNIGMNILNKDTDWLGRPKQKQIQTPPQNRFQGNTASSYGNFAMGGYAPLGPDSIKYIGPKHKDGGILIDEDGMPTDNEQEAIAEVEGGETRDDNYIFSDELKYPGTDLTFAEVHETMMETGASEQDIEELKAIQEEVRESTGIAAKERAGVIRKGYTMEDGGPLPDPERFQFRGLYPVPTRRTKSLEEPDINPEHLSRDSVIAIQEALLKEGLLPQSGVDGIWGPKTTAAYNKSKTFAKVDPPWWVEAVRTVLPSNLAQLVTKQLGNASMGNDSMNDFQKKLLYETIQKAQERSGVTSGGGTEYIDYSPEVAQRIQRGTEGNPISVIKNTITDPKYRLATTVGRGRYWEDPENPGGYIYTDVYDWNTSEKDFKPDNLYKRLRNYVRSTESEDLNYDANDAYRMNIRLNPDEFEYLNEKMYGGNMKYGKGGKMIKRADGSYSRRGLWDNIRANKGSGKKPTKQMLEQERKIKAAKKMMGGSLPEYRGGGYTVTKSDRKGKTHKVTGPDGTVKHFGDPNLKNRPNNPKAKKSWYARHKKSLSKNPHFRAYARATWAYGGEVPMYKMGGINNPGFRALPMEVQEKIKANMAMGGELDYMYGGDMPEYKGGGSINIAPEKRGTFKAQATKMGMGVQEAASTILAAPKGKYSPAIRRKANFARNFAKKYGGNMEYGYGGKMKYVDGGQLLETGLQYLPEAMTFAKGLFGREKTPEPTQIARTRIPYQDTTFNINPQLQRSSASYRGILADPAMTTNQKMAAYSQKLQNEGQLYGQKENIENQRRMQLASQQAQLDAGRRQTQAGLDEQARQERMMNDANYGLFGNIAGSALASASNKFLQQRGENRYFDLMNKMYGLNNGDGSEDENEKEPIVETAEDETIETSSVSEQPITEQPITKQPNTNVSVVDYLTSIGMDSSLQNRKALAESFGIEGYTGTAEQNMKLLEFLKNQNITPLNTETYNNSSVNRRSSVLRVPT